METYPFHPHPKNGLSQAFFIQYFYLSSIQPHSRVSMCRKHMNCGSLILLLLLNFTKTELTEITCRLCVDQITFIRCIYLRKLNLCAILCSVGAAETVPAQVSRSTIPCPWKQASATKLAAVPQSPAMARGHMQSSINIYRCHGAARAGARVKGGVRHCGVPSAHCPVPVAALSMLISKPAALRQFDTS